MVLFLYLAIGAVAGLLGGLFGVGGGIIIVPVLIVSFAVQGVSSEILTHMAVGTSLATIIVTSISSILAHNKRGAVDWKLFKWFTPGLCVGVWLGVKTASMLSGFLLQNLFGLFALTVGAQMALGFMPGGQRHLPSAAGIVASGGFIGWLSAIFGIGGGSLTVPFLSWCRVRMQLAVGTAAACGLPIALVGAVANVFEGWNSANLPAWSIGYVYLPAFFGIALSSAIFARVGAKLAHGLPSVRLKQGFGLFLICIGLYFLLK